MYLSNGPEDPAGNTDDEQVDRDLSAISERIRDAISEYFEASGRNTSGMIVRDWVVVVGRQIPFSPTDTVSLVPSPESTSYSIIGLLNMAVDATDLLRGVAYADEDDED